MSYQFSQQFILFGKARTCAHKHTHTTLSFSAHVCDFIVRSLTQCLRGEGGESSLCSQSLPVGDKPVFSCQMTPVSCPWLLTQLRAEAQPMPQFFLLNIRAYIHIAGADGIKYPASFPHRQRAVPVHSSVPKGDEVEVKVVAVRLGKGRPTAPIFRLVNKLQKQMDLGAEIHLAPLEWLKPPFADLF